MMIACVIFLAVGALCAAIGAAAWRSKTARRVWSNCSKEIAVTDVAAFNRAQGIVWILYGAWIAVCGLPMLAGQNSPLAMLSLLGVVFGTIAMILAQIRVEIKFETR